MLPIPANRSVCFIIYYAIIFTVLAIFDCKGTANFRIFQD